MQAAVASPQGPSSCLASPPLPSKLPLLALRSPPTADKPCESGQAAIRGAASIQAEEWPRAHRLCRRQVSLSSAGNTAAVVGVLLRRLQRLRCC